MTLPHISCLILGKAPPHWNLTELIACLYDIYVYDLDMTVYPKVSGLATWSENCKWYSSLPLGAVVSLFCKSV
jgi:hypothetical protein